jgi:hypothetical protein
MTRPASPSTYDVGAIPGASSVRRTITNLAAALLFAMLMMAVPWESLSSGGRFVDIRNYTEYFLYGQSVLEYRRFNTILDFATGEWLWHFLVGYLINDLGISLKVVFGSITFLCLSVFAYFLAARQAIWAIPLLVNPLFIHLAFEQLRIALAFSLLLLAYLLGRKSILVVAIITLGMIHSAIYLITAIGLSVWWIKRFLLDRGAHLFLVFGALFLVGFMVALGTGALGEIVLAYLGDRRAGRYAGEGGGAGLKFTVFWIGMLTVAVFQSRRFFESQENSYTIVILSFVASSFVFGGYTSRMIAISLPLILSAMINFRSPVNTLFVVLYLCFISVHWTYWFGVWL